jgi:hypothetical protein
MFFSGIDRVDSSIGYTEENTVPCCSPCNTLKGSGTRAEFEAKCVRIAEGQGRQTRLKAATVEAALRVAARL